jgi:hypothetical protein
VTKLISPEASVLHDTTQWQLVDRWEITDVVAHALRYGGGRRDHRFDPVMARFTAERLVQHLEQAGFALMKKARD